MSSDDTRYTFVTKRFKSTGSSASPPASSPRPVPPTNREPIPPDRIASGSKTIPLSGLREQLAARARTPTGEAPSHGAISRARTRDIPLDTETRARLRGELQADRTGRGGAPALGFGGTDVLVENVDDERVAIVLPGALRMAGTRAEALALAAALVRAATR